MSLIFVHQKGNTALDLAQRENKEDVVQFLVAHREAKLQSIKDALQKGSKPWHRSKIMIVGEGGAGKTALTNSIMGKLFVYREFFCPKNLSGICLAKQCVWIFTSSRSHR